MHLPEPQSVTFPSLFNQVEQRMVEKATSQKTVISLPHEVNERKIISSTRHFSRVMQREKNPCISDIRSYFSSIRSLIVGPLVYPERAPRSWSFSFFWRLPWQIKKEAVTKKLLRTRDWLSVLDNAIQHASSGQAPASLTPEKVPQLQKIADAWRHLTADDLKLGLRQKGVDMRIGIDITTLTLKKQVDTIILITGDSDFVPAAKVARREGVEFILDPLWQSVNDDLHEHVDGVVSGFSNPTALRTDEEDEELPSPSPAISSPIPAPFSCRSEMRMSTASGR